MLLLIKKQKKPNLLFFKNILKTHNIVIYKTNRFAYFVEHESGFCWGAFFQGRLIGYFLGLLVLGELDIVSIAVAKEFRRCSVCETLLDCVLGLPSVNKAFLEVESDNLPAIRLYEKRGFKQYGVRKKYYAGIKDAVLMKKEKC